MSRKHTHLPVSNLIIVIKAIAFLRDGRLSQSKHPTVVVLDETLWGAYRPMWGGTATGSLLGRRAEREASTEW